MSLDLSFLFNSKARPLIGLDISTSAVKMVELSGGGKEGYCVDRYVIELLPKDAVSDGNIISLEATAEAVKRAWRRLGTTTKQVAMALPAAAVITKKIVVPAGLREDELEMQVESEANQYIPFALDEVNLDFQVIGPVAASPDEQEVLIAASRKEKVEDRVAVAESAGLKAAIVDVESYAVQASFELIARQLPNGGKDKVVALVDVGAQVTNLTIFKNGQQLYVREQAFGGTQLTQDIARDHGLSFEEAEAMKRVGDLPTGCLENLVRPFAESLSLEVSRALQFFFTSTQFNRVDDIVLCGGCANLPGVVDVVGNRTQTAVHLANPFAGMTVSDKVRNKSLMLDAPMLLVATGLAMRRFDQ